MNIKIYIFIVLTLLLLSFDNLNSQTSSDKTADTFLNHLSNDNGQGMYDMFSEDVKKKLTLEQTSTIWKQMTGLFGQFVGMSPIQTSEYNGVVLCISNLTFEKGIIEARISIDKEGKISGFFITPKQEETKYTIPEYADTTSFVESLIKFGSEEFILNGVLSLPKSSKKTPVLILVHGSGPHDMDETIGPNKPFKDLAWGLASNGIAVMRYNKRTKQHPEKLTEKFLELDVYDEVINDAVYAVNFLIANADAYNIDKTQIYVLGHSLGGTLVPRIAEKCNSLKGIISMAGMTRKLQNVLLEQYNYLYSLDGEISDDEKKSISELEQQIKNMLSSDLTVNTPPDSLPLSMPGKYWLTFRDIDPASEILKFEGKILILQGLRDYQVTIEDYEIWRNALKAKKNSKLISYEDLNHLMQVGKGKSKPEEYYVPTKIDKRIILDITSWIKE
ncbi:DUF3887 domain-containing protein [Candidatus Kapaibacterium sp.]